MSAESRRDVERAAIEIASRFAFAELGCTEVRDVQDSNKGWDLEFVFPSGWWPVEVKGFAGGVSTFILTRNEVAAARKHDEYRILLITGVSTGDGSILELRGASSWIDDVELESMSWAIHGWDEHASVVTAWSTRQSHEA